MTGGWYVCIMDSGREERRCSWGAYGSGLGECSCFSKLAEATEKADALGSLGGAVATVGDAGAGEAAGVDAVEVLRRWSLLPLIAEEWGQLGGSVKRAEYGHIPPF